MTRTELLSGLFVLGYSALMIWIFLRYPHDKEDDE